MAESRINNSIKNTVIALVEQGVYSVFSFLCRTVFIYTLGKAYLGLTGLFSDILSLLSLAELGVGTAIIFSMYKPAANKEYHTLAALLNLYKSVYLTIGIVISVIGICITPFLDFFIADIPDLPELPLIYLLYLLNTSVSYFFVYKKSILIVNQRSYISSIIYIAVTVFQNTLQMVFLFFTHNFIVYLMIQVCCTFANNLAISLYVSKYYSYLGRYKNVTVDDDTRQKIYTNVKAMFLSKISSAIVTSTDNLLISKFVSIVVLGLYSNYTLFTTLFRTIISKLFEALTGSVGNLVALESEENIYHSFRKIWFVNYWLAAFCCSGLFALMNPFIKLWVGESFLLDQKIVLIICLNLYLRLIRNTCITFIDAYGLFAELKIKCIAEAIINLSVSLIFVIPCNMGIFGVLLGTFVSNSLTNFWYEPFLLYKKRFHVSLRSYFITFVYYFAVFCIGALALYYVCNMVLQMTTWMGFSIKLVICVFGINLFYVSVYHKFEEFHYFRNMILLRLLKNM